MTIRSDGAIKSIPAVTHPLPDLELPKAGQLHTHHGEAS
jgi:hypothetical protein